MIVGLFLALAVFAAKTGGGLAYGMITRKSRRGAVLLFAGYVLGYLVLIWALTWLLMRPSLLGWIKAAIKNVFQYGITVHLCISLGLFLWGVILTGRQSLKSTPSKAWLALVIPCPVCLLAISCSLAILLVYLQALPWKVVLIAWAVFTGTGLATAGLLSALRTDPDLILGFAMMGVSLYTLGSLFLGPALEDAQRVFRMAGASRDLAPFPADKALIAGISTAVAFTWGVLRSLGLYGRVPSPRKNRKGEL